MLAVFDLKEYQADVGSISHIHLLGKLRQLSELSQTELFYFIRNNVIDIIKLFLIKSNSSVRDSSES